MKKENDARVVNEIGYEKKERKQNKFAFAVALVVVAILLMAGTYAWLRIGTGSETVNKIKAGALDIRIDESATGTEVVRLQNEIPKSYRQGLLNTPYRFTIQNYSTIATDYTITLVDEYTGADLSASKIPDGSIRYLLVKNDEEMLPSNSKLLSSATNRVIDTETIVGGSQTNPAEISYALYIWIDSMAGENGTEADIMDMIFNAKIRVDAVQDHQ